jgi:inositol phosphorylceramide mannosyltransferase catalytic subunit
MSIPKIIHQTWKDENIPTEFIPFMASWKKHHPDWQFILWTDEMNKKFVEEHFPEFISIYYSYPYSIQRADAIRYLLLYKLGGVYIDLDIECLQNIEPLLENETCVIGKEPDAHSISHNKSFVICNAFMAAQQNDLFIETVIKELFQNHPPVNSSLLGDTVLNSTGPFMLNRIYESDNSAKVKLLESQRIHPLSTQETIALYYNQEKEKQKEQLKINGTYAIHYFWGTWWRKTNPFKK